MNDSDLWSQICAVSELRGEFKLRSGLVATTYFDKYQFESSPQLLEALAPRMAQLVPSQTEVLGGLELGGVPLAVAIALRTRHPIAFIRKQAKAYGTCRLAEGAEVAGRNVCLIEDVITTGGQVIQSAADLRKIGAEVTDVVCAIWRGRDAEQALRREGIRLHSVFRPFEAANQP
jgi:orotate phosphoribosyltransferase